MFKKSILKFITTGTAAVFLVIGTASPSANAADSGPQPPLTDQYVLSPTYVSPDGVRVTAGDGVEVHSGKVELDPHGMTRSLTNFRFGSSYASSNEQMQLWYTGKAYASGKKDYRSPNYVTPRRVIQVCFKYTRGGNDVLGWQCSNASLGPGFYPGQTVSRTVNDSLNPWAQKTVFQYSYKTTV
ncbi:hypothetical protein PT279_02055 [Bifidobacterium sp. ESL0784]|uniref:hypothetical protein n=1 Tax=Bifidobacterium sp. ESL0784 TaxID=2983231 RepID=UPI0023F7B6AD|nr:hypothetical protein [Bifidobacterium sp. ESL0784]MDF7640382.1 hypothetical protein [Bifidobacterium sp. ESL0784]